MSDETDYTTLAAEFAQSRKSAVPAPVTLADCRRALDYIQASQLVDNATHIRTYRYMLDEISRLLAGDFTAAEIHGFCHKLPAKVTREEFAAGCAGYQRMLYGPTPERGRMNRAAYERMIQEDLEWLMAQPDTLERDHIAAIVERSAGHEYGPFLSEPAPPPSTGDSSEGRPQPGAGADHSYYPVVNLRKSVVARAASDRRVNTCPRPPSGFDTSERRKGGDRRKGK